jgi:multidrug resistance efflux pump
MSTALRAHLETKVSRAEAALARAKARLGDAEGALAPMEAEHLADGDGYVGEYLLRARHDVDVATKSVARMEDAVADAKGRLAHPTLPGLEGWDDDE